MLAQVDMDNDKEEYLRFLEFFGLVEKFQPDAQGSLLMTELIRNYWGFDVVSRYYLVVKLIASRNLEILDFLHKVLLDDPSELIRHEVAFGIGQLGNSSFQEVLIDVLRKDFASIVRHEVAIALATVGDEDCVEVLLEVINNPSEEKVVIESAKYSLYLIKQKVQQRKKRQPH